MTAERLVPEGVIDARVTRTRLRPVPTYRVYSMTGDQIGLIEHAAKDVERGDVVQLPNGHDAIVTARAETGEDGIEGLLKVAVPPTYGSRAPWSRRSSPSSDN